MKAKRLMLFLVLLIIVSITVTACLSPKAIVQSPQQGGGHPQGEANQPQQGGGLPQGEANQPQPAGGSLQISFGADRTELNPGECVNLQWNVQGPHYSVMLDGSQVPDKGEKKVCPGEGTVFTLGVDTGEKVEERHISVSVGGAPPPPAPPDEGKPPAPPEGGESPAVPAVPPTEVAPPTPAPAAPTGSAKPAMPSGKGEVTADISPTDIFLDKQPHGSLWVRITNNGHDTLVNKHVVIDFWGTAYLRAKAGGGSVSFGPKDFVIHNLAPGKTQTINLGWKADTSLYKYTIIVTAKAKDFKDTNPGNNTYHEDINPTVPLATPSGGGGPTIIPATVLPPSGPVVVPATVVLLQPDLELADLKVNGKHLIVTVKNDGPGDISGATLNIGCTWKSTNYTTGAVNLYPGEEKTINNFNLTDGSSRDIDTGIAANTTVEWYEFDCKVTWVDDPDTSNNSRKETIPPKP